MNHVEEFLIYLEKQKKYSDNTINNYKIDLERYFKYLNKYNLNYKDIDYKKVINYISDLKSIYKSTSINRNTACLRSFYNYLIKNNLIDNNPFELIKSMKTEKKLPNYFKYNDFEDIINSIDETTELNIRNKCIFELLLCTGCRCSELINIKLKDLNMNNKEIKVLGKGNKERIVFIGNYALKSLEKYLSVRCNLLNHKESDYLFINHIGGNLTTRGVRDIIDRIILKSSLNMKITPHTFRHSFATMLMNEGCDIRSVQELLGHSSLSTTSIYTHISNEQLKNVYLHTHPRQKEINK